MDINVRTTRRNPGDEHENDYYTNAKSWVIDDEGRLHITKMMGGNAASYDRGSWASVNEAVEHKTISILDIGTLGDNGTGQTYHGHMPAKTVGNSTGPHLHSESSGPFSVRT